MMYALYSIDLIELCGRSDCMTTKDVTLLTIHGNPFSWRTW
jgi:hypothetical protein